MDTAKDKQPIDTGKKLVRHNCLPWMLVFGLAAWLLADNLGIIGGGSTISGSNWFPWLMGLICPLMMLFMMFGHGHRHNDKDGEGHSSCCSGHQPEKESSNKA